MRMVQMTVNAVRPRWRRHPAGSLRLAPIAACLVIATAATPANAIVCDLFQDKAFKVFTGITDAVRDVSEIMSSGGIEADPARDRKACDRARAAVVEASRGKAELAAERSKCPTEWAKYNTDILDVEKTLKEMQALACR